MEQKIYIYRYSNGIKASLDKDILLEPHMELTYKQLQAIAKGMKKEYKNRKKQLKMNAEEIYDLNLELQKAFNSEFNKGK